jgi:hypothetical protein
MTGWTEIWRAKGAGRNEAYLKAFLDNQGFILNAELFIEHHAIKRDITLSIGLNKPQLKSLLKVLGKDVLQEIRTKFVEKFLYADRFYEKNELQTMIKEIFDELEKEPSQ